MYEDISHNQRSHLPDATYEEISDEFLEGAFYPAGHIEPIKGFKPKTGIKRESQNKVKKGTTKGIHRRGRK